MEGSSAERCALATELAQVLEMVRQLEAHMGGGGGAAVADAGGQPCRAIVSSMRSCIDRSILIARSCCAEGRPESPPSGDGSPRSAGSDQAGDSRFRGNAAGQSKKRKTLPKWSTQVRVTSVQDVTALEDGFSWRKYGQKDILGAKYPRAYFRCTHRHTQGCCASKQVQRTDGDPLLFDVVYHGNHTCAQSGGGGLRPRPAASAEHQHQQHHQHPQVGQEQSANVAAGFKLEGRAVLQAPEPAPPQFSFTSKAPAAGTDTAAGGAAAAIVVFPGCAAAAAAPTSTFMAAAVSDCQVGGGGGGYAPVGGGLAGVQNVPDLELTSTPNSPMGDMDFMLQLDADFFDNPPYL